MHTINLRHRPHKSLQLGLQSCQITPCVPFNPSIVVSQLPVECANYDLIPRHIERVLLIIAVQLALVQQQVRHRPTKVNPTTHSPQRLRQVNIVATQSTPQLPAGQSRQHPRQQRTQVRSVFRYRIQLPTKLAQVPRIQKHVEPVPNRDVGLQPMSLVGIFHCRVAVGHPRGESIKCGNHLD